MINPAILHFLFAQAIQAGGMAAGTVLFGVPGVLVRRWIIGRLGKGGMAAYRLRSARRSRGRGFARA